MNNYYEWLELPLIPFEKNPATLQKKLESQIVKWNSSKNVALHSRGDMHGAKIKAAINDAKEWERIYNEYKASVDGQLSAELDMKAEGDSISEDSVKEIADRRGLPLDYVMQVARKKMLAIGDVVIEKSGLELEQIKPACYGKASPIYETLKKLSMESLNELIDAEDQHRANKNSNLLNQDEIVAALARIKADWEKIPASNPEKSERKKHIERICSGMTSFLQKYTYKDFKEAEVYDDAKKVLVKLLKTMKDGNFTSINEKVFRVNSEQLAGILKSRYSQEQCEEILRNYCIDKGWELPKPPEKEKLTCIFGCGKFVKASPVQVACPICSRSFMVKCPKCGKTKHLVLDSSCCGINLKIYPKLQEDLSKIDVWYEILSLDRMQEEIDSINRQWPNFPGLEVYRKKHDDAVAAYGAKLNDIKRMESERKYFDARRILGTIVRDFPAVKDVYKDIYAATARAEAKLEEYKKEPNEDRKIQILLEVLSESSDFIEALSELKKYPIKDVTNLTAAANNDAGSITLNWSSENKPNSVNFIIMRKEGSVPANLHDGVEVASTQGNSFADSSAKEGTPYFYAVYAQRGPQTSQLAVCNTPVMMLKALKIIAVSSKNCGADVTWERVNESIRVFYDTKPITKFGQGTEHKNITPEGFNITGLVNDTQYFFAAFKTAKMEGKDIYSRGVSFNVTPVTPIPNPEITKSIGGDGEYILVHNNPDGTNPIQFYYSDSLVGIPENTNYNTADLQQRAKPLNVTPLGTNRYSVKLNGKTEMQVYPVVIRGATATLGNRLSLIYVTPMKVKNMVLAGQSLCITPECWPEGAQQMLLCYNSDSFPESHTDCDSRTVIQASQFKQEGVLRLPINKLQTYYISFFARKGTETVPIGTLTFDNSKKIRITYSFKPGGLFNGKTNIVVESESGNYPKLKLMAKVNNIPIRPEDGILLLEIPELTGGPTKKVYSIPKPKAEYKGRLFSDNPCFELLLVGDNKLK